MAFKRWKCFHKSDSCSSLRSINERHLAVFGMNPCTAYSCSLNLGKCIWWRPHTLQLGQTELQISKECSVLCINLIIVNCCIKWLFCWYYANLCKINLPYSKKYGHNICRVTWPSLALSIRSATLTGKCLQRRQYWIFWWLQPSALAIFVCDPKYLIASSIPRDYIKLFLLFYSGFLN